MYQLDTRGRGQPFYIGDVQQPLIGQNGKVGRKLKYRLVRSFFAAWWYHSSWWSCAIIVSGLHLCRQGEWCSQSVGKKCKQL